MAYHLEFEKPVIDIESKIDEIKQIYNKEGGDVLLSDIKRLERRISRLRKNIFCKLSPWQKTQVARHPDRHLGWPVRIDVFESLERQHQNDQQNPHGNHGPDCLQHGAAMKALIRFRVVGRFAPKPHQRIDQQAADGDEDRRRDPQNGGMQIGNRPGTGRGHLYQH